MSIDFSIADFVLDPPAEFALLGLASGELKVFLGPFEAHSTPTANQNYLYSNNFFLSEPAPFLACQKVFSIPATRRSVELEHALRVPPRINWEDPASSQFLESYSFFRDLLLKKSIIKAVPISFHKGTLVNNSESNWLSWLIYKTLIGQPGLYSYALRRKEQILIGASPEILFSLDNNQQLINSEAVAGSIIKTHAPLSDITGKLKEEHELVVNDLVEQLQQFGSVSKGEISLKSLASLSHLRTPLEVRHNGDLDIMRLLAKLHPSGALGILPRAGLDHPFMKALDMSNTRGAFGAPFGALFQNGDAVILVAIRNLMISQNRILLGAGAGITAQSEPNSELAEVLAKQQSVKTFFGLE